MAVAPKTKGFTEPARAIMLGMAVVLVMLAAVIRTSVAMINAFIAVLLYMLPALFMDDVGKVYMDAATVTSITLAFVSVEEAILVNTMSWGLLVMLIAPFPPIMAGRVICLIRPRINDVALAIDIAMFGFFTFIDVVTMYFDVFGHSTLLTLLVFIIFISYCYYTCLLFYIDEYGWVC
jgi:hypothetical protein